jgi:hypothetical protein
MCGTAINRGIPCCCRRFILPGFWKQPLWREGNGVFRPVQISGLEGLHAMQSIRRKLGFAVGHDLIGLLQERYAQQWTPKTLATTKSRKELKVDEGNG